MNLLIQQPLGLLEKLSGKDHGGGGAVSDLGILGDVQCAATSVQGVLALCRVDTSGTLSNMATLASLSAVTAGGAIATGRFQTTKLSLSDDAAVQYAVLAAIASGGTQSTSFSINGVVLYETGGGDS